MMTDQEEAQCREAFLRRLNEQVGWHSASSMTEAIYSTGFGDGFAARPEPVLGEVYIEHAPATQYWHVCVKGPEYPVAFRGFLSSAEAEQYLAQFPKREGQAIDLEDWQTWPLKDVVSALEAPGPNDTAQSVLLRLREKYTKPQPDNSSAEGAPMVCKQCGADRAKEDCKGADRMNCDIKGVAQAAPKGE